MSNPYNKPNEGPCGVMHASDREFILRKPHNIGWLVS